MLRHLTPQGSAHGAGCLALGASRKTAVTIVGDRFLINGRPTYAGRTCRAQIEGLLMNSRMVQGIFDDLNPETRTHWAYPDTGKMGPGAEHARVHRRDAGVAASTAC